MDIKYLAIDIDGTLNDSDGQISENTKNALIKLQKEGKVVVISTGRSLEGIEDIIEELELKKYHGYAITNNGAFIYDATKDEIIHEEYIDVDTCKHIFEALEKYEVYPSYRKGNKMYVKDAYEAVVEIEGRGTYNIHQVQARGGNYLLEEVTRLKDSLDTPLLKIEASGKPEYIKSIIDDVQNDVGEDLFVFYSVNTVLEISKKGVNKSNGLRIICADLEKTMSFGDSMNDFDMVRDTKYGIAMDNADDRVKEVSFDITASNDDEGVYKALKKYKLI